MLTNPRAGAEAEDDLAREPAGRAEIDILDRRGIAQLRLPQALREAPVLARRPFRVDQEAEPVVETQGGVWARAALLLKGRGHRHQAQGVELLDRRVCQHKPPRSRWRRADSRATAPDGQEPAPRAATDPAD